MALARSSIMVGRDTEWQAASVSLEELADGRGGLVVVTGEAGMGKSRLARELSAAATARGCTTLLGRGSATDSSQAYRILTGALAQAMRAMPAETRAELDELRPALANLLPGLVTGPQLALTPLLVAETVLRLAPLLGRGHGTVLLLEDLHWADAETIAVLDYLADYLGEVDLLVLATARPDPALDARYADWTRRDATSVIRLDRLTPADTALLVRGCVGEEREVPQAALDLIVRRSDGIPFLVEELSTALVERGTEDAAQAIPPSFAQSVVDRLTMLGPHAAGVLTTASVLGREVDWQLVRDTTGESTATVLDTLARAIERGLVDEPPGGQMRFRHALTAEAIRATLPRPRLIELASRLLDELVRDEVPNDRLAVCAELAVLAERRPEACRHLVAQARNALATGSVSTAIATAERAVQLVPAGSEDALAAELVLLAALDAAGEVVAAMRVGLSVLDRAPDTSAAAEVLLYLARASVRSADLRSAREFCLRALQADDADPGPDADADTRIGHELALALRLSLAETAFAEQQHHEALTIATAVLHEADAAGDAASACSALELLGRHDMLIANRLGRAREHFTDLLRRARDSGLDVFELRALHQLAYLDLALFGGRAHFDAATAKAARMGALAIAINLEALRAIFHMTVHDLSGAIAYADRALAAARRYQLTEQVATLTGVLATCEAMAGRTGAADERIERALAAASYAPNLRAAIAGAPGLITALARDDVPAALACIARTRALLPGDGIAVQPLFLGMFHALAAVVAAAYGTGGLAEGRDWVEIDDAFLSSSFTVARAIAAGRSGARREAEALFEPADARLAGSPWVQALFRLLAARAARRDGWGDPKRLLSEAASFFATSGNAPLADACAHTADAPSSASKTLLAEMTDRETDVLALLCDGLTNQQIATRLSLSPRTVEKHVERMLAKTHTANRTELVTTALRTGSVTRVNH